MTTLSRLLSFEPFDLEFGRHFQRFLLVKIENETQRSNKEAKLKSQLQIHDIHSLQEESIHSRSQKLKVEVSLPLVDGRQELGRIEICDVLHTQAMNTQAMKQVELKQGTTAKVKATHNIHEDRIEKSDLLC